ncbi:MAG: T9SS type A sorting domain-containing protein [Chitinophagales bacterium]
MKKQIILLSCLFLFFNALKAQQEFAPIGAKWHYGSQTVDNSFCWIGVFNEGTYYEKWEATEVAIFDGETFNKIEIENPHLAYQGTQANLFYVRENNGIVSYYHDGNSYLLFDFNKNAGETWTITIPAFYIFDAFEDITATIKVDSTNIEMIDNEVLKSLYVSVESSSYSGLQFASKITEKIGADRHFLPFRSSYSEDCTYFTDLRCYEDFENSWQFGIVDCDYTLMTSIDEIGEEQYIKKIDDKLYIDFTGEKNMQFQIYNLAGHLVQQKALGFSQQIIDISFLEKGMYIAYIYDDMNNTTFKFFK